MRPPERFSYAQPRLAHAVEPVQGRNEFITPRNINFWSGKKDVGSARKRPLPAIGCRTTAGSARETVGVRPLLEDAVEDDLRNLQHGGGS